MDFDIHHILNDLSKQRPVFHSEADFQHALAWDIHTRFPEASVELEVPCSEVGHVDCRLTTAGKTVFIELKYKTARLTVDGDEYALRKHAAQDLARYDFLKDIRRLEQIIEARGGQGMAIFLTNDLGFWAQSKRPFTVDAAFRLHENALLRGSLGWAEGASAGTKRNREKPISLANEYPVRWHDYSTVQGVGPSLFRYCVVDVPPAH